MLYRNYDQAALDRQYNNRGRVADFSGIVAGWARRSAHAREVYRVRADLAYGPSPAERLDLYLAEPGDDAGPRPLHAFIHGGYWQAMGKRDFGFVADGFLPAGAHLAVIGYALAPAVTIDEIVRQSRAAVAWLRRHAAEFNADPKRISISGHSAGGHLVAMLLLTDWKAFDEGLPERPLSGGVAISGIYDLEPIRLSYLNEKLALDAESVRRNSPLALLDGTAPAAAAPLVLCVGGAESEEFHRQQADFAAAWRRRGYPVETMHAPGLDHFAVLDELSRRDRPLNRAALRVAFG